MSRSTASAVAIGLAMLSLAGCEGSTSGVPGSGPVDAGAAGERGDGDTGKLPFDECASVSEVATNTMEPVDIVFTIDNTPSMLDEINEVRANMNRFSQTIADRGIDAHIVLISCLTGQCDNDKWHGICIDPPVGAAGGCGATPAQDTNPPAYLHVNERIPSLKGLGRTVETFDQWKSMLRPGATKHFVFISDDNDEWSAAQFNDALLALDPTLAGYKLHGIFSFRSKEDACAIAASEPCCTYAAPGGEGKVYRELVQTTGGVSADLCQQDFDPVFDEVAGAVIAGARLHCSWPLPAPPDGQALDPRLINVELVDAGDATLIGRVSAAADCDAVEQGWFYDDPAKPTEVLVCPQTCEWIQGRTDAAMQIHFGCESSLAPLK